MSDEIEDLGIVESVSPAAVDLFGSAPSLLVAFPAFWASVAGGLPLEALLDEWALMFDPAATLRDLAMQLLNEVEERHRDVGKKAADWKVLGESVRCPSLAALTALRLAAKDEEVANAFKGSHARLIGTGVGDDALRLSGLTTWNEDNTSYVLRDMALPITLGIAAIAAVVRPVGPVGRSAHAFLMAPPSLGIA